MKKTFTSLLLFVSLATQAQVDNTIIASYNFDGNVNNAASNSWNGTAVGNPTYTTDRFGVSSNSLNLDGVDDKVLFGDLPIYGNFSISLWLNAPSAGINATQQSIISKRATCGVGNFFDVRGLFTSNPNSVNIEALNGSGVSGSGSGANITKNEWVHVVYVFDSLAKKTNIYIDGVISTTRNWDASFKTMSNDASFGIGNSPCAGNPYKGAMDDLKVYSGALSANEVNYLFKENNYCKPVGGTVLISENKVLDTYPNGALVGKITKTKPADEWLMPADSANNSYFTYRNDSIFTNNLTLNNSTILLKLNNCENKTQQFTITKGNASTFLISKYSFTNSLNDESGNGFNGKYFLKNKDTASSFVNDRTTTVNSAIALNGVNDYYALGDQPWDNGNLTISFWLKPENNTKDAILFSKRAACTVGNFIDVRYNVSGVLGAEIRNGSGFAHVSSDKTLLPTNQWHHAVIVLDKSKGKSLMYINGNLANTTTWSDFASLDNNAEFKLGASPCSVNNIPSFNGLLDDIAVYSLPLTQTEITNLYNDKVTSIDEVTANDYQSVYPNPTIDEINVAEFSEVYDIYGKKVAEGASKINLTILNKGIYIVKSKSFTTKVIKN